MTRPAARVVVVGGGLAGITAALDCADAGATVTLLERRPRLGGLTWSFEHHGRQVDNGQHVFLRCCTAYLALLDRIGSRGDVVLQDRLDVPVVAPAATAGGPPRTGRLRRTNLPAPLHLVAALARYPHLRLGDRLRLGRAVLALRRADLGDPALDDQTFGAWLAAHGQTPAAVANLWDLITVPTVNLGAADASLAMAAKVFQTGLLTDARAADIGWARVPLGELHGKRAHTALVAAGVDVQLASPVTAVEENGLAGGWAVTAGETRPAEAVVVAVPHQAVNDVLAPGRFPGQDALDQLGQSAVVDVHLVYDRPVTTEPLLAAVGSPIQWVFDRTSSSGLPPGEGQYLAVSLSDADSLLGRRPEDLIADVAAELPRLLPAAGSARLIDSLVTKERTATFRARPGTAALRPAAATPQPGLALAGAWTDTGWPATMEGAVRSGHAAAAVALRGARQPLLPQEVA